MSRQRESKEEVARRALAEFCSQIDEVARSSGGRDDEEREWSDI